MWYSPTSSFFLAVDKINNRIDSSSSTLNQGPSDDSTDNPKSLDRHSSVVPNDSLNESEQVPESVNRQQSSNSGSNNVEEYNEQSMPTSAETLLSNETRLTSNGKPFDSLDDNVSQNKEKEHENLQKENMNYNFDDTVYSEDTLANSVASGNKHNNKSSKSNSSINFLHTSRKRAKVD